MSKHSSHFLCREDSGEETAFHAHNMSQAREYALSILASYKRPPGKLVSAQVIQFDHGGMVLDRDTVEYQIPNETPTHRCPNCGHEWED